MASDASSTGLVIAQRDTPKKEAPPAERSKTTASGAEAGRGLPSNQEQWSKFFASPTMTPEAVQQLVADLSSAKRFDDVIPVIEQALIHGKSQPWMYEVLALTMEIAQRPRAQVERVLLSANDLTTPDVDSLLFQAAYLARFERFARALQCCRQAAELEPNRPEPYAEMLRIAVRAKDLDAQSWAAVGVLTYAWGPEQAKLRDEATDAVARVRTGWREAGRWVELAAFENAVREAERIDVRLRLEWSGSGDLDLVVTEPPGSVCSREQRYSTGGGILTHDGRGPTASECYDEYVCPIGWPGEYRVRIEHSWGAISGKRATLIVTRAVGTPSETRDVLPIAVSGEGTEVRITLKDARRTEQKVSVTPRPARLAAPRPTVVQQLAAVGQAAPGGPAVASNAVGYQPVVQFFNEGIALSAMATVSGDRRYVRLSLNPVFSDITDVFTFSYQR